MEYVDFFFQKILLATLKKGIGYMSDNNMIQFYSFRKLHCWYRAPRLKSLFPFNIHQFNLIPFVGLGLGAISALTGTAGSNYGAQATTQGAALGQLGGTLGTGLGLNQQLQGLGGLLQTQGSTGSTALTGGVTNSTSALLGRGSSYGVDSTASAQSSYGLQNLSSFGITAGSTTSRLSDGVSRGYTPSSGSNNTNSSGTRVFVRNVSMWQ